MTSEYVFIETHRLRLKGISWNKMNELFSTLDPENIKKTLGHRSEEEYEKELEKYKSGYSSYNRRFLLFLLELKDSGEIIGRCGIHNWNEEHQRAEIGYSLNDPAHMNKGYMSEAASSIIQYCFETLKLHRLEALASELNIPSIRIIKKNGFQEEGVLREHWLVEGKFEDTTAFSILSSEYFKLKK